MKYVLKKYFEVGATPNKKIARHKHFSEINKSGCSGVFNMFLLEVSFKVISNICDLKVCDSSSAL